MATAGQKLSDVSLDSYVNDPPGKFSWDKPANSVGDPGSKSHSMIFTPTDTEKYNTLKKNVSVSVLAEKMEKIKMVLMQSGEFTMGATTSESIYQGERQQHQVTLTKSFYMGTYEVTQAQWYAVMGLTQAEQQALRITNQKDFGRGDNYPVYCVNWFDAIVFCNKLSMMEDLTPAYSILGKTDPDDWDELPTNSSHQNYAAWSNIVFNQDADGYRLPTEAQWEYACRAGRQGEIYYTGATITNNIGWYKDNSDNVVHEVGLKHANINGLLGQGLYDMAGNVAEWCWDRSVSNSAQQGGYSADAVTDPTGPTSGEYRRVRGGSFDLVGTALRSAYRGAEFPYSGTYVRGFRVVLPVTP